MKNIEEKLIPLLTKGHCTPQISGIAKKIKEPSTTIHYNIKRMEKENKILIYKAVFDYKKIEKGFCSYVLINTSPDEYSNPERIAKELSKFEEIESIDVITGGWEILVKVRTKDIDSYYLFVKSVLSRKGVSKITSLNSLKQIKTEFVSLP
ncbi:MAG: Lrp/AsnC family transcriptional regulator [Candidatus Micrarchaeia archaeon]